SGFAERTERIRFTIRRQRFATAISQCACRRRSCAGDDAADLRRAVDAELQILIRSTSGLRSDWHDDDDCCAASASISKSDIECAGPTGPGKSYNRKTAASENQSAAFGDFGKHCV